MDGMQIGCTVHVPAIVHHHRETRSEGSLEHADHLYSNKTTHFII